MQGSYPLDGRYLGGREDDGSPASPSGGSSKEKQERRPGINRTNRELMGVLHHS